jgi:hypothetical protein
MVSVSPDVDREGPKLIAIAPDELRSSENAVLALPLRLAKRQPALPDTSR